MVRGGRRFESVRGLCKIPAHEAFSFGLICTSSNVSRYGALYGAFRSKTPSATALWAFAMRPGAGTKLLRRCVGEAVHPFSRAIQPGPHGAVSLSRYARLMSDEVQLSMSLPLDGDGFLRRECPTCEREFKWLPSPDQLEEGNGESRAAAPDAQPPEAYYCPYCAVTAPPDAWSRAPTRSPTRPRARRTQVGRRSARRSRARRSGRRRSRPPARDRTRCGARNESRSPSAALAARARSLGRGVVAGSAWFTRSG
jgi:hypothetical protein